MKKSVLKTVLALSMCLVLAAGVTACGEKKESKPSDVTNTTDTNEPDVNEPENNEGDNEVDISSVDFSKVDEEIAYGDYAGMETLSKSIQNLEAEGKVVKITGDFEHFGSNWSIMQKSDDGSSLGTVVKIVGDQYPDGDVKATITGVVVHEMTDNFPVGVIYVTPENFTVVE